MRIASLGQLHLWDRRKKANQPPYATEFRLACAFADTLRRTARKDWRWSHFPAGEFRETVTGERLRRMGLAKGWPDYLFLSPVGQIHCLELKRGRAPLTTEQEGFRDFCKAHGVPWVVARSYDDAIAAVTKWGVLKLEVRPQ